MSPNAVKGIIFTGINQFTGRTRYNLSIYLDALEFVLVLGCYFFSNY